MRKPKIGSSKISHVGWSTCKISYEVTGNYLKGQESIKRGFYFICGRNAYFNLPLNWEGSCYLALLFPDVYSKKTLSKSKRSVASDIWDIFGIMIPPIGVAMADKKIRRLTEVIDNLAAHTSSTFRLVNEQLIATRAMVLQNRLALDIILQKRAESAKLWMSRNAVFTFLTIPNV